MKAIESDFLKAAKDIIKLSADSPIMLASIVGYEELAAELAGKMQRFDYWKAENTKYIFHYHGKEGLWYWFEGYYYTYSDLWSYWLREVEGKK